MASVMLMANVILIRRSQTLANQLSRLVVNFVPGDMKCVGKNMSFQLKYTNMLLWIFIGIRSIHIAPVK